MTNIQAIERTKEFSSIIQSLVRRSQIIGSKNFKSKSINSIKSPEIDHFKKQAKKLTKEINETEEKIHQMSILVDIDLVGNKTEELMEVIRTDLSDMSRDFTTLQQLLSVVTAGLSPHVQTRAHVNGIAVQTQKRMQNLIKTFKDCVKIRESQSQKSFMNNLHPEQSNCNKSEVYNNLTSPIFLQRSAQMHENELRQRDKSVRDVEATIVQLGDVFEQFSSVVQEQEELVLSISNNANTTFLDIEEAHTQLTKYFHAIKDHRMLMIRFFIILAVLIFIFMYFL